eukprot:scaffold16866_cov64-Phaeocystis_antarctica.AAC.2
MAALAAAQLHRSFSLKLIIDCFPRPHKVGARGSSTVAGEAEGDGCGPSIAKLLLAAAGSQGPKPEIQIFPRSRSLNFSPRCHVAPFSYQRYRSLKTTHGRRRMAFLSLHHILYFVRRREHSQLPV